MQLDNTKISKSNLIVLDSDTDNDLIGNNQT